MTDMRYGNTRVAKIKAAYDDLRSAIRAGDIEKAEAALDRYEQWADYVFAPAPQDRFIAAADAAEVAMSAMLNEPGGLPWKLYNELMELRAAREAITRGAPPAFATSA